jgi:hypothetical protein
MPVELGCFMTRMRIITTTKLGNNRRNPSGIDIDELPFNLMRLRKKDNDESAFCFSLLTSPVLGVGKTPRL